MTLWIDAQLSPSLAAWVNENYTDIMAASVRALGLRDATDMEIFMAAREANAVIMTKDEDSHVCWRITAHLRLYYGLHVGIRRIHE